MKRIGILTGGGDCPGLNAVIRAVVKRAYQLGNYEIIGIRGGWRGLVNGEMELLTIQSVTGILHLGGTILGTSRTNPFKIEGGEQKLMDNFKNWKLDALIAIGGEDTLGVANKLYQKGIPVVGVPKTIDNDLQATDFTFGFDTAVSIATEAIDRLHSTAESHERIMVVEVMGRHTGWIATYAGLAGGADVILIPEIPIDIDAVCNLLLKRLNRGRHFSIVVVAEGARFPEKDMITLSEEKDEFGHVRLGGIGYLVAKEIEKRLGWETRVTVLGHLQRGGSPTAYDRILATRFGVFAMDLVHKGEYGKMAALKGNDIVAVDIADAVSELKKVDMRIYEIASIFFG